jgi:hypothetical protein
MWPFRDESLIATITRVFALMDEMNERDGQLAEIEPFIKPIVQRAASIARKMDENDVPCNGRRFLVSATEMDYIKKQLKILIGRDETPVMYLGMKVVVV